MINCTGNDRSPADSAQRTARHFSKGTRASVLRLILFYWILIYSSIAFANYNYQWRNFTRYQDGLTSNTIRKIVVGKTGQVWVATDQGLLRFDGFWHQVPLSVPSSENLEVPPVQISILDLLVDRRGNLWIATNIGIFIGQWPSDRQQMIWTSFQTQKTGLLADYISVIAERRNGEVWVGTPAGVCWQRLGDKSWQKVQTPYVTGIYEDLQNQLWLAHQPANRVDDGLALLTLIEPDGKNWQLFGTQDGLPNGQIQAMVTDRQNRLWVGTTKGLAIYNEQKWSADLRSLDLIGHNVQTLHFDQNQILWVGTNQGIRLLTDLNSGNEVAYQHLTKSNGIAGNNITTLCESPSGNIWVGTRDNGISFSDRSWRTFQIAQPETSRVTSFATDARGSVWIGMQNGIGRIIPDPQHNQLSRLDLVPQSLAPNTEVRSVAYATNGEVWAGTAAGVLIFDGRTWSRLHLPSGTNDTQTLIIDEEQQVWLSTALLLPGDAVGFLPTLLKYQLGTPAQEVEVLGLVQNRIGRAITNLFVDSRRHLLLGTVGNMLIPSDLWIYDLTTDQLTEISQRQFGQIQAILEIGLRIWVGTNQGIYILNLGLEEKIEHHYTTNVGLIDNNVQALFQDRQGRIWVGTSEGVSVFERDRVVRQLTIADGLGSNNILAITQTDTNEMLFGTAGSGISYFKQELVPPVTRIVEGPSNNEIVGETSVTFKFEGGDASSQAFHYRYQIDQDDFRLTGDDGNENRVVLSGLSEGRHHFEVQAIDRENNVDPVGATATFIIDSLPPLAQIFSPVDGQVVGGKLNIQGTATDSSDFSNYTIQIFSDAGDRKIIHHVVQPVDLGTLFSWHTNGFPDGAYSVQLTVKDTLNSLSDFQHTAQTTVDLIVDNTPPEVNIQSPRSGEQLSGTVRLNFGLQETHPHTIQLRYRRRAASSWLSFSSLLLSDLLGQSGQPGLYSYLWDTTSIDGQVDLRIQALDLAGNLTQSSVIHVTLDNPSARPNVHLEPIAKIVSGTVDIFATIRVGLANEAQIQTALLQSRPLNKNSSISLSSWQTIWFGNDEIESQKIAAWDTTNLDDGQYQIQLQATDGYQYHTVRRQKLTVDNQPPVVAIQKPSNGQVVGQQNIQISGLVRDDHLDQYTLSYRLISPSTEWVTFWTHSEQVTTTTVLTDWNTFNLVGSRYRLRLRARDLAGLLAETVVDLVIDVSEVKAQIISPQPNQMVSDTVEIIGTASDENLQHFQIEYRAVDTPLWQSILAPDPEDGPSSQSFDVSLTKLERATSKVNQSLATWITPPTDGTYQIRLTVIDLAGKSKVVIVPVLVDNLPPKAEILTPRSEAILGEETPITGSVNDAHFSSFQLDYRARSSDADWQPISVIDPTLPKEANLLGIWQLPRVDGQYQIRLQAKDQYGRVTIQTVSIMADNRAPVVEITVPAAGAIISGKIPILGSITDLYLDQFELKVRPVENSPSILTEGNSADWQLIQRGTTSLYQSQLTQWATPDREAVYEIKLSATDISGNEKETSVVVSVDNRPPQAQISTPQSRQQTGQTVTITGIATDRNFAQYQLEYAQGWSSLQGIQPKIWSAISARPFRTPVKSEDLLAEWRAPNLVGHYTVRLQVTDAVGHENRSQIEIYFNRHLDGQLATSVKSQDERVRLVVAPNSLGAPTVITINPVVSPQISPFIESEANQYQIRPSEIVFPVNKPAVLSFQTASAKKLGIFHWHDQRWQYIGGTVERSTIDSSSRQISVPIRQLGRYSLRPEVEIEATNLQVSHLACQPRIFSPNRGQSTAISFSISQSVPVTISIYDTGNRLKRLVADRQFVTAGHHVFWWDGHNHSDQRLVSDIYIVLIQAGEILETKVVVVKND